MQEAERLLQFLREKKWSISVAESCTGGFLCGELVKVPGASDVFMGGVVAYSPYSKKELGVPETLIETGLGSFDVAESMARRAIDMFDADVGLATTGAAGPGFMQGATPGEVYVSVVWPQGCSCKKFVFNGAREEVMKDGVFSALSMALEVLAGQSI